MFYNNYITDQQIIIDREQSLSRERLLNIITDELKIEELIRGSNDTYFY